VVLLASEDPVDTQDTQVLKGLLDYQVAKIPLAFPAAIASTGLKERWVHEAQKAQKAQKVQLVQLVHEAHEAPLDLLAAIELLRSNWNCRFNSSWSWVADTGFDKAWGGVWVEGYR